MDTGRAGKLIRSLRTEKGLTQLQFAELIGVTDKAVSKWERGLGSPDISLLPTISFILGVNIDKILAGELPANAIDNGNMNRARFYLCPDCGAVLTSTSEAEISCCGRKLSKLQPHKADEAHRLTIAAVESDYYITCPHEMTRPHHIRFMACVAPDRLLLTRLYPEQEAAVRIPRTPGATLFYYCTQHGLMEEFIE